MADGMDLPGAPKRITGFPENYNPYVFDVFAGVNTKATRPAIKDEEMSWSDGFMPLGPSNLRTLYDVGDPLYTTTGDLTITFFGFGNAGQTREQQTAGTPICIIILSDGSALQVNVESGVQTPMAPAGTFTTTTIGMSQYGNQYIILVADQTDGYFLWDTVNFYQAGGLAPGIEITNGGTGYLLAPTIGFTGGSGSGATATAVVVDGVVTEIYITNPGSGYVVGDTVTVTITPTSGGSAAAATVTIMPFGIQGSSVETYTNRVWVSNDDMVFFTAPSSVSDFSNTNGGGDFRSNDSFLKVGYTRLRQSNGFLYLLADSSINYISGVQTGGTPVTTTFSNLNVDPQIGTPYPNSVQVFSRNIMFANNLGIFLSVGGAVTKNSSPLDGVYNTVPAFGGALLSGAVANIFNIQVYMALVPIIDPISGQQVNKLLMTDGKRWWTSPQSIDLTFITSQEISSVLTAWGTDDTSIYPLFQTPSVSFRKVVQSKLYSEPTYYIIKESVRYSGIFNYFTLSGEPVNIAIDNEYGAGVAAAIEVNQNAVIWTNDDGDVVTWTNDSMEIVTWYGPGLVVFTQSAYQSGRLLGLTLDTLADDLTIVSNTLIARNTGTDL